MTPRWTLISPLLIAATALLSGCSDKTYSPIKGSGISRVELRNVQPFKRVALSGAFNLVVTRGDSITLAVDAEENLFPYITTVVSGETLDVGSRQPFTPSKPITIRITHPALEGMALSGSGNMSAIQLASPTFRVELSGSGDVILTGQTNELNVILAGSGNVDAKSLTTTAANITISGAGNVHTTVRNNLIVNISGAGNVTYAPPSGTQGPNQVSQSITGAGSVRLR